jgi:Protein of unknown function (DUF3800)
MQILFVDESGTPPSSNKVANEPWFVLGGIIIPEEFWHRVKNDLDSIKRKYSIIGEIKWRFFAPQKEWTKQHSLSHLNAQEKEALRTDLYGIIGKYKSIKTLTIITNTSSAYKLPYITTPDDLYWYTYKQITERFQYYLQDISKISGQNINGIIVCDHRAPKDDKRLQELHSKLLLGSKDAHSNFSNLIEGVFIAPSHLSIGIQFADLVAGAILRKYKDNDERFFKQIESTFRKSEKGITKGYGIVDFPKM